MSKRAIGNKIRTGQIVHSLTQCCARGKHCLETIPQIVRMILESGEWKNYIDDVTGNAVLHDTFLGFVQANCLEGLEIDIDTLKLLCVKDPEVITMIEEEV
jgi:hypothetical protein